MKTKLYKTYSRAAKNTAAESVFINNTDEQIFAHRSDVRDFGKTTVCEKTFTWTNDEGRTIRIFITAQGDYGYRAFGSGIGDDGIALRIFDDEEGALAHFDASCLQYKNDTRWHEATND